MCEHLNKTISTNTQDSVCFDCGEVLEQCFQSNNYNSVGQSKSLDTNYNPLFLALGEVVHKVGNLGSTIYCPSNKAIVDYNGIKVSGKVQTQFTRLMKMHNNAKVRNFETSYRAFKSLSTVVSQLGISNQIRDRASYLFKKITNQLEKGEISNHIHLIALCLLLAIKESGENAPITLGSLVKSFQSLGHRIDQKSIIQISLQLRPKFPQLFLSRKRQPSDFIPKILSDVLTSERVRRRIEFFGEKQDVYEQVLRKHTLKLLEKANPKLRGGRNPFILSVASVYSADKLVAVLNKRKPIITQKILSDLAKCPEYTIRDHWRGLFRKLVLSELGKKEYF